MDLIWLRVLSRSYISALTPDQQESLRLETLDFLKRNVPEFTKGERSVEFPHITDVFWCTAL